MSLSKEEIEFYFIIGALFGILVLIITWWQEKDNE